MTSTPHQQKVAIQGIKGSYHYQVALNQFGQDIHVIECLTFSDLVKSITSNDADIGVLALENSIAGAILPNYDLMDRNNLQVIGEFYLPISHQLMVLKGQSIDDITEVRSHPMALLQCKAFFEQYPQIKLIEDLDTASVAKEISEQHLQGVGAIAGKSAAEFYGLDILASDIQTIKNNITRFCIVKNAADAKPVIGFDKASIKVTIKNEQGSLAKVLTTMSAYRLDLTKIQSLPVIDQPWHYAFFIDLLFENLEDYQQALKELKANGHQIKVLGEYKNTK
ncbi:prephenate dehydratase [Echinicola vietnamensis]|uniref:prephenate dehydratase n=1 Tax=Echinicola vietnamensis (strain DSM 17526 / LMG 23754 / KMM 6221) TaxID=926556 RepID=L0FUR4_ECHVK|nr:prephenate dehydratase [Echinicola vietnamensis]AGA76420.1 prephenate dehydratase [Echinicola vietnamensis DSM 17526]